MVLETDEEIPSPTLGVQGKPMRDLQEKLESMEIPNEHEDQSTVKDTPPNLLLDMPDDPMKEILANCDFIAVQTLRKVCHPLRDFIDKQKIDPKFTVLFVKFRSNHLKLRFYLSTIRGYATEFVYKKAGHDTKIIQKTVDNRREIQRNPAKMVKNATVVDIFCQDFQVLTQNSKTIPSFFFNFETKEVPEKVVQKFQNLLKTRNFKTDSLSFTIDSSSQLLSILPFFDSQFLKNLSIKNSKEGKATLDMEGIKDLEQWRKLEKVTVENFTIKDSTMLTHLKEGHANVLTLTRDHLKDLIESFRNSPNFFKMALEYPFGKWHQIVEPLGDGYVQNHEDFGLFGRKLWFFQIPNNENYVLCVEVRDSSVTFLRYERKNVPAGVGVKDRVF